MRKTIFSMRLLRKSLLETLPKLNIKTINQIHSSSKEMLDFFPKKSKALVMNFFQLIFSIDDPLHLIIRSHLYTEVMLNTVIRNNFKNPEKIIDFSYSQKIKILFALGKLDNQLYADLNQLNQLRNKFAHNLKYDIAEFDFSKFSDLNGIYVLKDYTRKSAKKSLNLLLFKYESLFILEKMTNHFKEIYLIDK
jgi:hypothetical protein